MQVRKLSVEPKMPVNNSKKGRDCFLLKSQQSTDFQRVAERKGKI